MTVGSPPSMTATTEFVVPRSMPMILPMGRVAPSSALVSGQGFGRTAWFDRIGGVSGGGDRDEGRPNDAVPEPVAAADLLDDLALGAICARDVQDRLVLARIEGATRRRVDRRHTFALQELAELAIDGRDALEPGILGDRSRTRLDRAVEVVGKVEDLADQILAGETEVAHPLLGRAPSEVLELGAFALKGEEIFVGRLAADVQLGGEPLDLVREGRRRDVDIVGPRLGAGSVA